MNVILIILDSLRKDHVGAYGNDRIKTPNLDALAAQSLRFDRAYPESMPTIPARRAIHTGMRTFPFRDYDPPKGESIHLYGWQPISEGQTTLAEILRSEGYTTMFVTDTQHQFKPSMNFQRGFGTFYSIRGQARDTYRPPWMCPQDRIDGSLLSGPNRARQESILRQHFANTVDRKSEEDYFAPQVFATAAEFLRGARDEQPFFMLVDSFDPHEPWDPPERYVSLYDDGYDGPEPYSTAYGKSDYLTDRQLERMRSLYAGEVTMADRWLGRLLDEVDALDLKENTIIMVISDHGHSLGEHGVAGKLPWAMYPELIDVPFLIDHPESRVSGEASDHYASTHDVAPTVLGALGIESPSPMDGQDLSVLLNGGDPEPRPYFTAGYHDHVWARDEDYVLIARNSRKRAQLYDLREDPGHQRNIAEDEPGIIKRMFEEYVLEDAGGEPLPRYGPAGEA